MIRLQTAPIETAELIAAVRGDGDGAVALFLGTVRNLNRERRVLYLEYQSYEGMAESELERIVHEATGKFTISRVAVIHRTGRVEIGEASVGIAVSAPHRAPALEACRFVIDTLTCTVPIWKREHFEGGAVWIEGPEGPPPPGS